MSGALIVFSYLTAIIVGVRWQTLPEDIANVQTLLKIGANFTFSVFKQLCKKRLSFYTDNSFNYPRPPRTQIDVSLREEQISEEVSEGISEEEEESLEDEKDESAAPESEEDADVHGDVEEPEKED